MTEDAQQEQPKRVRLRVKLDTVGRVASELARVYRQVKQGDLSEDKGTKRAQILTALRSALEAEQFELRLQKLEQLQASEQAKVIEHRNEQRSQGTELPARPGIPEHSTHTFSQVSLGVQRNSVKDQCQD